MKDSHESYRRPARRGPGGPGGTSGSQPTTATAAKAKTIIINNLSSVFLIIISFLIIYKYRYMAIRRVT